MTVDLIGLWTVQESENGKQDNVHKTGTQSLSVFSRLLASPLSFFLWIGKSECRQNHGGCWRPAGIRSIRFFRTCNMEWRKRKPLDDPTLCVGQRESPSARKRLGQLPFCNATIKLAFDHFHGARSTCFSLFFGGVSSFLLGAAVHVGLPLRCRAPKWVNSNRFSRRNNPRPETVLGPCLNIHRRESPFQ